MVDHNQAESILGQARELLTVRLSELILEHPNDLLADASGESYMGEISTVYEKVGGRLAQVNSMLGHLQALHPISSAPSKASEGASGEQQPATFKAFAEHVAAGNLESAQPIIASLLALDVPTAERATSNFAKRLQEYPKVIERCMQLRVEIDKGNDNGAIMILLECFAISGSNSLRAIAHLKQRFAA